VKIDIDPAHLQEFSFDPRETVKNEVSGEEKKDFSTLLSQGLEKLNASLNRADEMAAGLASGREVDVPETMIAITKADISFKLFLQIRNKALSAYEEIMRLQV